MTMGRRLSRPLSYRTQVETNGSAHRDGVHSVDDLAQVLDVLRLVVRTHEGNQGHLVAACQVAEHVVGAHLGAGVERVGEDLGQKEDAGHCQWIIGTDYADWRRAGGARSRKLP